jgi:hypothetical protein
MTSLTQRARRVAAISASTAARSRRVFPRAGDFGQIPTPAHIRPRRRGEVPAQRIRRLPRRPVGLGQRPAFLPRHQALFAHQLRYDVLADPPPQIPKVRGDPRGAIGVAAREGLDNLTFVINCNLQRLDGPVRGNGKIIQELESYFRGAGWNVIKVIWGRE